MLFSPPAILATSFSTARAPLGDRIKHSYFCGGLQLSRRSACRVSNNKEGEGSGVDWDKAWQSFKQQLPEVESRGSQVTTEAPRFASKRGNWNRGQQQEQIKQQEQFLLNVWSQDTFFKGGGVAVIAIIVLFTLLAGPPPSDSRCTLPWC